MEELTTERTELVGWMKRQLSVDSEAEELREQQQKEIQYLKAKKYMTYLALILGFTVFFSVVGSLFGRDEAEEHHHNHSIPTLLSVRDVSGKYINALQNDVYEEMKYANFEDLKHELPQELKEQKLKLNKDAIFFHDELIVSFKDHSKYYSDDDIILAMYCPSTETNPKMFRDAASIAQVKATMSYLNRTDVSAKTSWVIPKFPIVKEHSCEFRLWHRNETEYGLDYDLHAKSDPVELIDGVLTPTTIHLSHTRLADEMRVSFSTGDADGLDMVPVVQYSKTQDFNTDTSHHNIGVTTTYTADDLCSAPANLEEPGKFSSPKLLHTVRMYHLDPNTRYYYKVGLVDKDERYNVTDFSDDYIWSKVYSFVSPLLPGSNDNDKPLSYIVYSDQGVKGYGQVDDGQRIAKMTENEVVENGVRAVHHFGDLSYAMGAAHVWDAWFDLVSTFSTSVPLMIGIGNHEYDHREGGGRYKDPSGVESEGGYSPDWGNFEDDSSGECGVPVSKRFTMPRNGNGVFWYSYDVGLVHTIVLSGEHDLSPGSRQYKWLEADLASVDRSFIPWIIIETHRPMYMIEDKPKDAIVGQHMREDFEELIQKYKVDLFLSGHYHAYFRSCKGLYKEKCNNGGLTHITVGTAGAELDDFPLLRRPWADYYVAEWGYGKITVANATALKFEFIADSTGKVKDSIWLRK